MTYDNPAGRTAASGFALAVVAHREKYGNPTDEQMAKVSIKNHFNATKNPIAQSPAVLTLEEVLNSRKIVEPFRFYDNCLYTEGSSAVILASEEAARKLTDNPIWISGLGCSVDYVMPGNRHNIYTFESSRLAAQKAFKMAGIKRSAQRIWIWPNSMTPSPERKSWPMKTAFFARKGRAGA